MAEFEYNAKDREGRPVTGRIEADDIEQAVAKLLEQRLSVSSEDVMLVVESANSYVGKCLFDLT